MGDLSFIRRLRGPAAAAAVLLGLGLASAASAGICPTTGLSATVTRVMEAEGPVPLPPDQAQCYAYGSGNINGNIAQDPLLNGATMGGNTFILDANSPINPPLASPDITYLQGTSGAFGSFTGVGSNSGTFTINAPVGLYAGLIVGLKIGGGGGPGGDSGNEPDWFSWVIPNVAGTYNWGFDSGTGFTALSHGNIYGYGQIPLPAAAWLMLAAIGGLGVAARRRKAA